MEAFGQICLVIKVCFAGGWQVLIAGKRQAKVSESIGKKMDGFDPKKMEKGVRVP